MCRARVHVSGSLDTHLPDCLRATSLSPQPLKSPSCSCPACVRVLAAVCVRSLPCACARGCVRPPLQAAVCVRSLPCACARGCVRPPLQALASLTSSLCFPHSLLSLCLRWSLPFISSFAHSKNRASFFSKLSASNTNYVITIVIRKSRGSYNHSHHQSNEGVRDLLSVAALSHVLG